MVTLPGISAFFGSSSHRPGPDSKIAMAERIARLDSPRLIRTSGRKRALRPRPLYPIPLPPLSPLSMPHNRQP